MQEPSPEARHLIDGFGKLTTEWGLSRTVGRILAWLLLAERPQSLDEIARGLGISKAAASQGARLLDLGTGAFIERVTVSGDRRAYYEISAGLTQAILNAFAFRLEETVRLAEEGLRSLGEEHQTARRRLAGMSRIYRRLAQSVRDLQREEE